MIRLLSILVGLSFLGACATVATGRLDSYDIVDCELPGVILHIGTAHATTGRARAIRTSADDCGLRGGYYAGPDRANYETALRVWLAPAEDGDAQAQYNVGQIYEKGLGRPSDPAKAAQWYQRAADAGSAQAMTALGMLYERGLVSGGNAQAALELYRRAANLQQPLAYAGEVSARDAQIRALQGELAEAQRAARAQRNSAARRQRELEDEAVRLRGALQREGAGGSSSGIEGTLRNIKQALEQEIQRQASAEQAAQQLGAAQQLAQQDPAVPAPASDAPQIELVEPAPTPVRGLTVVRVRGGARTHIRVRVRAQSPLQEVRIGEHRAEALGDGDYAADIGFDGKATPVEVSALDTSGRRALLSLLLAGDSALPAPAAVDAAAPGRYHALVIGNARYASWAPLDTPHHTSEDIAATLRERYGFEVTLLLDATRAQTFRALAELRRKLGENDNLIVFYSGHGSWDAGNLQGYWVPVDGDKDSVANFISSSDVTDQISVMRARQILVVADSCYSGVFVQSIVDDGPVGDVAAMQRRARIPSRKVMSSGNIREVMDGGRGGHSVFAAEFLDALRRHADAPFEARQLYQEIAARVQRAADGYGEQQEPQYGQLRFAGHVGGDFLFVPRGSGFVALLAPMHRIGALDAITQAP